MVTLDDFIVQLAQPIAYEHECSLDEAKHWVEIHLIAEAREAYRQAGAPLGDSDEGFLAWLQQRH
jgi:hypothetical protein